MAKKNLIPLISFIFIQLSLVLASFHFLLQEFNSICLNKDFLSWDADLRLIKTIQMMDNARNFELFSFLFQLLDTPTWPILRNLVQIFVFLFTGISTYADHIITIVTFLLLIGLIIHILYYLSQKKWISLLLFLPVWMLLILSPPFLIYSFSAMLEVQGSFFFLASIYYLIQFYQVENSYLDKTLLLKLSLSIFGLFNTKYPYAYLLILAILILHTTLYFEEIILFSTRYIAYIAFNIKKQYRVLGMVFLILVFLFLPESLLKGKSKTYIKYTIVLLGCLDFYLYLFSQTTELINLKFEKLTYLFKWAILPIVVFVLIHPDRFSSSSSTLAHVQAEGHMVGEIVEKNLDYYLVFIKSITNHSFTPLWIGYILFFFLLVSVVTGYYSYFKKNKLESHFFFSIISLLTIFILTFFTPNHQERHIYHLIPAILIGVILFIGKLEEPNKYIFYGLIFGLTLIVIIPFYSKLSAKFSGENICYVGKNKDDFFTPREIEKLFRKIDKNTIFFNFLNPIHVNKADTELVLTKIAYENKIKILINPKKFKSNPREYGFEEAYIISDSCEKDFLVETWFHKYLPSVKIELNDDPKLSITYKVETKEKPFILAPPYPAKNLLDRKIYKDPKYSTGDGCLQTIRFAILP